MSIKIPTPSSVVHAQEIGRTAQVLLTRNQVATVLGVTSRGVFLRLEDGWVIFLSNEPFRSPLTVNLEALVVGLRVGELVTVQEDSLRFNSGPAVTGLKTAGCWEAPRLAADRKPAPGWLYRLKETSRWVLERVGDRGMAGLLAPLLGLELQADLQPELVSNCLRLQELLRSGEWQAALPLVETFLGNGIGLTPAGDDFVLGLLLGLKRLSKIGGPGKQAGVNGALTLTGFGEQIVQAARSRTTALSASLIACAAQGQADERLVSALDGITSGSLSPQSCAELLLTWGSSSGGDSLAGMALSFTLE